MKYTIFCLIVLLRYKLYDNGLEFLSYKVNHLEEHEYFHEEYIRYYIE